MACKSNGGYEMKNGFWQGFSWCFIEEGREELLGFENVEYTRSPFIPFTSLSLCYLFIFSIFDALTTVTKIRENNSCPAWMVDNW